MRITLLLLFLLLNFADLFAQDTIVLNENEAIFNTSIANRFTIYEVHDTVSFDYFLDHPNSFKGEKLKGSVANLDFTTGTYFIHFTIVNTSRNEYPLLLETARPITNSVELYFIKQKLTSRSGDAMPFKDKTIVTNRSVLPLMASRDDTSSYILKLKSDGEIISLPMIFWKQKDFYKSERKEQFISGIFYGIFLFVIIIYFTFFLLLKDRLFLLYICYVAFSGLLQFALDGHVHEYFFQDGGYMTQHSVIFIAGGTVFFALTYATVYLDLQGRLKRISQVFSALVLLTTILSSIPGSIYATCYPICNGFSLIALVFLLYSSIKIRRKDKSISLLFMVGLSALLLGAIIFILGNFSVIDFPSLTQNSLKTGTLIEIICLSILMAGKYKLLQDEKEDAQKQLLVQLEETNIQLELEVADRTKEIEDQKIQLKEKNEDFIASIKYAERIQNAILPHEQKIKTLLPDSFVVFKPKDIVSGDFYWVEDVRMSNEEETRLVVYATADCTGHGVPGAFVSIVCSNLLKLGKSHPNVNSPGEALDFINTEINETLNSEYSDEEIRDGMDVALCALDLENLILYFAGAKSGVTIIRKGEIIQYKGDRKAIGNTVSKGHDKYTTHEIKLEKNDIIYTFTDGIVDQFGGPFGKKFMSKRTRTLLASITHLPLEEQKSLIENEFLEWMGDLEQVDDVLVIGVKI
jgi:serine phosphatase RsbU (regulator of sigma subunit)